MRPPTRTKAAFFLAVIFLAGSVVGAFGGYALGKQRWTQRPPREDMVKKITGELRVQLKLTETQLAEVEPIVRQTSESIRNIHAATREQVHRLFEETDARVAAKLTPEQQPLMKEWVRKREDSAKKWEKQKSSLHNDGKKLCSGPDSLKATIAR